MKHPTLTKIVVYRDRKGGFRWRMLRAGKIVADSGEGYTTKAKCVRTLRRLVESFQNEEYEFE